MSLNKSNRAGRSGANTELMVLVLDTLEDFMATAVGRLGSSVDDTDADDCAVDQYVYLTSTSTPPVEPSQGREPGAVCAVLSFRLSFLDIACYVEPLPVNAIEQAASSERAQAIIEERLAAITATVEATVGQVRRGRWHIGGFISVAP